MPDYLSSHTGKQIDDAVDLVGGIESDFEDLEHKVDDLDTAVQGKQDALPTPVANTYLHADGDGDIEWASVENELPTPVADTYLHADSEGALEWATVPDEIPTPVANTYLHADGDGDLEWSAVSGGSTVEVTQQGGATDDAFYRPQPRDITVDGVISNNDALVPIAYSNLWSGSTFQNVSAQYGLAPNLRTNSYIGIGPISSRYFRQTSADGNSGVYDYYFRPAIATPLRAAIEVNVRTLNLFYDSIDSMINVSGKSAGVLKRDFARGDICVMTIVDVVNDKITPFNYDKTYTDGNGVKHHIFLTQLHEDFSREKIDVAKNLDETCTITQTAVPAPSVSTQFGGGFHLDVNADTHLQCRVHVLGANLYSVGDPYNPPKHEEFYGWHTSNIVYLDEDVTCDNVSIFVLTCSSDHLIAGASVQGTVYAYDGTPITSSNLTQYLGKMLYTLSNVKIEFYYNPN